MDDISGTVAIIIIDHNLSHALVAQPQQHQNQIPHTLKDNRTSVRVFLLYLLRFDLVRHHMGIFLSVVSLSNILDLLVLALYSGISGYSTNDTMGSFHSLLNPPVLLPV